MGFLIGKGIRVFIFLFQFIQNLLNDDFWMLMRIAYHLTTFIFWFLGAVWDPHNLNHAFSHWKQAPAGRNHGETLWAAYPIWETVAWNISSSLQCVWNVTQFLKRFGAPKRLGGSFLEQSCEAYIDRCDSSFNPKWNQRWKYGDRRQCCNIISYNRGCCIGHDVSHGGTHSILDQSYSNTMLKMLRYLEF
jgi:hypothetical protein